MADITVTAANVRLVSGSSKQVTAGESITQGQPVYLNTADNEYYKAVNSSQAACLAAGIALTPGENGESMLIAVQGAIVDIGGTVAIGDALTVSSTAGAIHPEADLASTEWVTYVGHPVTTANILVTLNALGVQHA